MKIVAKIGQFTLNQSVIIVSDDGDILEVLSFATKDISNSIVEESNKGNINDIVLVGPHTFTEKIKDEIGAIALTNYNKNNLNITLL